VDDLDFDILRWMYPGGVYSPWGTDPRITASEIASHVKLDRTAIWARVRRWRRDGFWDGYQVNLNPRILGTDVLLAEFHMADAAEGWALVDRLETLEGVVHGGLIFGDTATTRDIEVVLVQFVADDPEGAGRMMKILRRLAPGRDLDGPYRHEPPPCSRTPTPLDWRIIAAMVANPNASPSRLARLVGVTNKTLVHHHSALLDDHAVFYYPKVDWSKLGCVTFGVFCRDVGDVDSVRREVEARYPHSIPLLMEGIAGVSPGWDPSRCFAVIVAAHSPGDTLSLAHEISRIPGVRLVRPELWGPQRLFYGWINRRIAEHLAASGLALPSVTVSAESRRATGRTTPLPVAEFEIALR
jgi:DNA-binding Lrp family transcriptional regulator